MKITDIINASAPSLSFEVFPPKTSDKFESVRSAVNEIAKLSPSYMSVTYGAGGGTSQYTVQIAKGLNNMGVTALAHLTCISSDRDNVRGMLAKLKEEGIENILALRGDILPDTDMSKLSYHYADELVKYVTSAAFASAVRATPKATPTVRTAVQI